MEKALLRSEIAAEDKWRVEDIYESDEVWEADYNKCLVVADESNIYQGRLDESAEIIYEALKESDETDMLIERVYVYAFMKYYEDTSNPKYQEERRWQ